MKFWIDAQLPPAMAVWLPATFECEAATLAEIGLRQGTDPAIFTAIRKPGQVIVTKDDDFIDLVTRLGAPPQVLWVTCGNVTNRALRSLLDRAWPSVLELLRAGEPIVELREK